jgi:hypothetical protein
MNKLSSMLSARLLRGVSAGLLIAASAVTTGCLGSTRGALAFIGYPDAPVVPPIGGAVTMIKAPLQVDFNDPQTPVVSPRTGSSKTRYLRVYWISIAWGDGSLDKAAAGMQKVHYADYEFLNVVGVYQEMTFHAYGE